MGTVFPQSTAVSPISIIPQMLHPYPFICHWRQLMSSSKYWHQNILPNPVVQPHISITVVTCLSIGFRINFVNFRHFCFSLHSGFIKESKKIFSRFSRPCNCSSGKSPHHMLYSFCLPQTVHFTLTSCLQFVHICAKLQKFYKPISFFFF